MPGGSAAWPRRSSLPREEWLAAWLESPVWRFMLPPGLCGKNGVLGLWLPSVDKAGRYSPLTIAATAPGDWAPQVGTMTSFLAAAEQAGLDALEHDLSPAELLQRIQEAFVADDATAPAPDLVAGSGRLVDRGRPAGRSRAWRAEPPCRRAAALPLSSTMAGAPPSPSPRAGGRPHGSFVMSDNGIAQDTARFGSFRSRAATHAGTAHRLNEDAYVNRPDLGLWAVADGAGGHESGEVASAEVASLLQTIDAGLSAAEMLVEVRTRLEAAHARLHAEASRQGAGVMVATTVVVLLARDDHFACLWAGDFRAYLLRDRTLTRITRDHSLVQALVESGTISEAEATHHPQANVITRAVGADSDLLELEKRTGQLLAGDRLLLCSDGLCKTLTEEQLAELLSGDDDTGAERLVMAALTAQVTDNVTVVTIGFDAGEETVSVEAVRAGAAAATAPEAKEQPAEVEPGAA